MNAPKPTQPPLPEKNLGMLTTASFPLGGTRRTAVSGAQGQCSSLGEANSVPATARCSAVQEGALEAGRAGTGLAVWDTYQEWERASRIWGPTAMPRVPADPCSGLCLPVSLLVKPCREETQGGDSAVRAGWLLTPTWDLLIRLCPVKTLQ